MIHVRRAAFVAVLAAASAVAGGIIALARAPPATVESASAEVSGATARESCGDRAVQLRRLEAAFAAYSNSPGIAERAALYDAYDEIALAGLCRQADQTSGMLRDSLLELPHDDKRVDVVDLRRGERLVVWTGLEAAGPGGGRASILIRERGRWRRLGYVDADTGSWFGLIGVDPDAGIALLEEDYSGNGWPPSRALALAVAGGRVVAADSGEVASVETEPGRARPRVIVGRIPDLFSRFGNEPLRLSRWVVERRGDDLRAVEEPLTPWVDALVAFCSGAHPERADPSVRARVARCDGPVSQLRWTRRGRVVADLPLVLWCRPYDDKTVVDALPRDLGELTLARRSGQWRVVSASSCD